VSTSQVAIIVVVLLHGTVLAIGSSPPTACLLAPSDAVAVFEVGTHVYTLRASHGLSCMRLSTFVLPIGGALMVGGELKPFEVLSINASGGCLSVTGFNATALAVTRGLGNATVMGIPLAALALVPEARVVRCPGRTPRVTIVVGVPVKKVVIYTTTTTMMRTVTVTETSRATVTNLEVVTRTSTVLKRATTTITSVIKATRTVVSFKTVTETYVAPATKAISAAWGISATMMVLIVAVPVLSIAVALALGRRR